MSPFRSKSTTTFYQTNNSNSNNYQSSTSKKLNTLTFSSTTPTNFLPTSSSPTKTSENPNENAFGKDVFYNVDVLRKQHSKRLSLRFVCLRTKISCLSLHYFRRIIRLSSFRRRRV